MEKNKQKNNNLYSLFSNIYKLQYYNDIHSNNKYLKTI